MYLSVVQGRGRDCESGVDYERLLAESNTPRWLHKLKKYGFLEQQPSR